MHQHFLQRIGVSTTINFFLDLAIFVMNRIGICIRVVFKNFGSSFMLLGLFGFFVFCVHRPMLKTLINVYAFIQVFNKYILYMIRVTANLVSKFSGIKIKIPQQEQGDKLCLVGKLKLAANSYTRVIEIMNSAKINQKHNVEYLETIAKLAACQFLNNKNQTVADILKAFDRNNINEEHLKYFTFLEENNKFVLNSKDQPQTQSSNQMKQIKSLVNKLLNKNYNQEINKGTNRTFPVLSKISQYLNNRTNYQKYLVSLIERSPKSPKSQKPSQLLTGIANQKISTQLLLLYYMGAILSSKALPSADKAFINEKLNQILKDYESNRQKQIYKPLLVIIMSLIGEKHYMSAQGMIGHVKTEQLGLIGDYHSQDKILVNNIYRMLVTRANNEPFEIGWAKEEPILLGNLVAQRIIKAPLFGHPIEGLIC